MAKSRGRKGRKVDRDTRLVMSVGVGVVILLIWATMTRDGRSLLGSIADWFDNAVGGPVGRTAADVIRGVLEATSGLFDDVLKLFGVAGGLALATELLAERRKDDRQPPAARPAPAPAWALLPAPSRPRSFEPVPQVSAIPVNASGGELIDPATEWSPAPSSSPVLVGAGNAAAQTGRITAGHVAAGTAIGAGTAYGLSRAWTVLQGIGRGLSSAAAGLFMVPLDWLEDALLGKPPPIA